jgi:hypothetical protein
MWLAMIYAYLQQHQKSTHLNLFLSQSGSAGIGGSILSEASLSHP